MFQKQLQLQRHQKNLNGRRIQTELLKATIQFIGDRRRKILQLAALSFVVFKSDQYI